MPSVTCLAHQPTLTIPTKAYEPVITELRTCNSTPTSEMSKVKRIDHPAKDPKSSSPSSRRPSQTSTSTSIHSRSASRSTARSRPDSRRSSFQSARRAVPNAAIVPIPVASARTSQQDKRETLIALHRQSCRLFQGDDASRPATEIYPYPSLQATASSSYRSSHGGRPSSDNRSSTPSSPVAPSHSSFRFDAETVPASAPHWLTSRDRANTMPNATSTSNSGNHHHSPSSSSMHIPAMVMEWTSPDTRRREYEKIDRASSGVRGLWRRVAPRCFQTRDSRVPFFEEGKPQREGSVRRFRMDLPEDEEPVQPLEFLRKNTISSLTDVSRRRWACLRSKTSPA
ncbi:hypothetical protein N7535_005367 [Penicillium sp. DV-2018c]|nr:hypothetical protein N7461_008947 [Penicillium sp. DV-2018c]KAJ5571707.1 hypothetical protein N7535_005367 [Penicillium sp. DV-2018c]